METGLRYKEEVNDCLQTVRRCFANIGIPIRDYAFPSDFWQYGDSMFERLFEREGFYEIDSDVWKPQAYDLLLVQGSLSVAFPTHLGVLTEDGRIIHHFTGRRSEYSEFKGLWRTPTKILRHKDVVPKVEKQTHIDITELMPSHVRNRLTGKAV